MLRGIYGDPERFVKQYWSRWTDGVYFTGDGARRDDDGYFWLLGRVDDVLNVAGHRLGTMEVESALVDHPKVAEAAVVGRPHEIKGQAVAAFVTLKEGVKAVRRARRRAEGARRQEDRRDRAARSDPLRRRPAEDAVGQDHAAAAARHRRRQGARRHDDAGRSGGRRAAQGRVRREGRIAADTHVRRDRHRARTELLRARPRRTARVAEDCVRGSGDCTRRRGPTTRTRWSSSSVWSERKRISRAGRALFHGVMATRRAWRRVRGRGDGRGGARPTRRGRLRDRFGGLSSAGAGASRPGTSGRRAAGTAVAALSLNSHGAAIAIVVGHRGHPLASRRVVARDTVRRQAGRAPSCSIATSSFRRLRRSSNTISISSGRSTA